MKPTLTLLTALLLVPLAMLHAADTPHQKPNIVFILADEPLVIEALDGKEKVSATWPESVSLYKRGENEDGKMYLRP